MIEIDVRLPPEDGMLVVKALEALADKLADAEDGDDPHPPASAQCSAEHLVDNRAVPDGSAVASSGEGRSGSAEPETVASGAECSAEHRVDNPSSGADQAAASGGRDGVVRGVSDHDPVAAGLRFPRPGKGPEHDAGSRPPQRPSDDPPPRGPGL